MHGKMAERLRSLLANAREGPTGRRAPARPVVECEILEGRQLLTAGAWHGPATWMAHPPMEIGSAFGHRGGPGRFAGGFRHHGVPGTDLGGVQDAPLKQDLQKLQADEQAIRAKSQVTPAMRDSLRQDFQQVFQQGGRPTAQASQTLQADLANLAQSGAAPTADQSAQVQADFQAALQSTNAPQALIDRTIADSRAILSAMDLNAGDYATLAADHKAVQADLARLGIGAPSGQPARGMPGGPDLLGGAFGPIGGGFGHHGDFGGRGPGAGTRG